MYYELSLKSSHQARAGSHGSKTSMFMYELCVGLHAASYETLLLQLVCYQGLLQRRQLLLRLALRAHVERERCQHTSAYVSTPASLTCKPLCTVSPDLITNWNRGERALVTETTVLQASLQRVLWFYLDDFTWMTWFGTWLSTMSVVR
jgi:hypothetical protein